RVPWPGGGPGGGAGVGYAPHTMSTPCQHVRRRAAGRKKAPASFKKPIDTMLVPCYDVDNRRSLTTKGRNQNGTLVQDGASEHRRGAARWSLGVERVLPAGRRHLLAPGSAYAAADPAPVADLGIPARILEGQGSCSRRRRSNRDSGQKHGPPYPGLAPAGDKDCMKAS